LEAVSVSEVHDIEGLLALDARARLIAAQIAERLES
jgi:1-deoxy-D-xylulose-5-phosphate reductoisomerase